MNEDPVVQVGIKLAAALEKVVADAEEAGGGEECRPDLRELIWEWHCEYSFLLQILVAMGDKGYSITIEEPHYRGEVEDDMIYPLSAYGGSARKMAAAAHKWHDQMDLVDFYFYKEDDPDAGDWLIWVPSNDRGEQLADYIAEGDVNDIVESLGGEQ